MNLATHDQTVLAQWLPQPGLTVPPPVQFQIHALSGIRSADFVTTYLSQTGLGAIIITSANNFDTATTFVPIILIMLMAVALNFLIGAVERWVAPWQAEIAGRDE